MSEHLPRRILVTDGEQRSALATVRSLGRAGNVVFCCSNSGHSMSGASHYTTAEYRVADPLRDPARYVADVRDTVRSQRIDALLPMTEAAMLALLPARSCFEGVLLPFAGVETFQRICDKAAVLQAAERLGIAVPQQHTLESADDALRLDPDAVSFPVVIKPARSVAGAAGDRVKLGVQHASSVATLRAMLDALDPRAYPILIQQRVIGPGIGVFLLIWDGEVVASFSHRRIREKPPSGGVSVYRESIPMDASLLARSRALLHEFQWQGVAMIEYKLDAKTNVPYLMEINGRFWGSLQLAIDAGIDFPKLLVDVASGNRPSPVTSYDTSNRLRWFWGDVDQLLSRIRRSNEELDLPNGSLSRWAAIRDFLHRGAHDRNEILRGDDPKPFVRESVAWFRQLGSG